MTATIGSGYSNIYSTDEPRRNNFAKASVSRFVQAGGRQTQQVTLYLTKGSYPIASEPSLENIFIT